MLWGGKLRRQEPVQIGSSSMKILCDNSIVVEQAQETGAQERQPYETFPQ